jgi:NAD(P)-dependent dehydrogenase (short-subunit alcohol dehydrogenase family)
VITVTSDAHAAARLDLDDPQLERGWDGWRAYANSKLANILFTRELARRLAGTGVTANCSHPGMARTRFGREARLPMRAAVTLARPSMTASAGNGFGQIQAAPTGTSCTEIPSDFHPMYSTSSPQTRVPWAAHSYNVAFDEEIGHQRTVEHDHRHLG